MSAHSARPRHAARPNDSMARALRWAAVVGVGLVSAGASPRVAADDGVVTPRAVDSGAGLQAILTRSPASATPWASSLIKALEAYTLSQDAQESVKKLRADQDNIKTELVAVNGMLDLATRERQQLEGRLEVLEGKRQERMLSTRKELEARLQEELAKARTDVANDLQHDFDTQVQAFDARQGSLIEKNLDQDIELQEREIQQLGDEIETLGAELRDRLARLQPSSDLARSLQASIGQVIQQRKQDLQTRRTQVKEQREQLLASRRKEFIDKLHQQQAAEQQTRMMYKEASLRQAMAELLHKSQTQTDYDLEQTQQKLEEAKPRQAQFAKRQALLTAKLQELDKQLTDAMSRIQANEGTRGESLVQLEQSFRKSNAAVDGEGLQWFGQVIQQAPTEMATELNVIYRRLRTRAEQERQLRVQEKMLRERQMATQVSHEMERRYQEEQAQHEREVQARLQRAQEQIDKAKDLQANGRFDDALRILAQVQAATTVQSSQVMLMQQDIKSAKTQTERQAKAASVEKLFNQAMRAFEQGRYAEAVPLFEQVISQESELGGRPTR